MIWQVRNNIAQILLYWEVDIFLGSTPPALCLSCTSPRDTCWGVESNRYMCRTAFYSQGTGVDINVTFMSLICMCNYILLQFTVTHRIVVPITRYSLLGVKLHVFGKTFKNLQWKCCCGIHEHVIDFTMYSKCAVMYGNIAYI